MARPDALVVDASALVEYLAGSQLGQLAGLHIAHHAGNLHVPHLAVIETASALRTGMRRAEIPPGRAKAAVLDLRDFQAIRWPGDLLLPRIWELRENVTAYDACYVALAELLDATLLTADRRLANWINESGMATCSVLAIA